MKPCPRCGHPGPDLRNALAGRAAAAKLTKARRVIKARMAATARWTKTKGTK